MRHSKIFIPLASLALALAASLAVGCAREDLGEDPGEDAPGAAIRFSPYVPVLYTRAGDTGAQDLAALKAEDKGFGVFAYYTDNARYGDKNPAGGTATLAPNFMYNEHVHWLSPVPATGTDATMPFNGTVSDMAEARWVYAPIKFWPNEHGAAAASTEVDRVSFFAYAPYIGVEAATGEPIAAYSTKVGGNEVGIVSLSPATANGDPKVRYNAGSQVDLMWAVVPKDPSTETPSGSGIWIVDDTETTENGPKLQPGLPWHDMTKQRVNGTVRLHFLHALAGVQMGKIRGIFDETENPDADYTDLATFTADPYPAAHKRKPQTRILVEKVTLTIPAGRAYGSGTLNLNNTTPFVPRWEVESTDYLSAADAHELTAINPWIKELGASYFTTEHDLETLEMLESEHPVGVVHQNLPLTDGTAAPLLLLNPADDLDGTPDGLQTIQVAITYSVNTYDTQLSSHWERHEQTLTRDVTVSNTPGTLTTIHVLLGMTTVKFEAEVGDWADGAQKTIYVPQNITD